MNGTKTVQPLWVAADKLPAAKAHYVAWLDVMGVQSIMSRSLSMSANFILKFHAAALESRTSGVEVFPVMDGLYAVASEQSTLKLFISSVMVRLANTCISEKEDKYRFVVRGGLAYGSIIRGVDVSKSAAPTIAGDPAYASTLLLGMPVIQAHVSERLAPPFGIFVNESARGFASPKSGPFVEVWWHWFEPGSHELAVNLRHCLEAYYAWCAKHPLLLLYDAPRIAVHLEMTRQFLPES
jgi:hypothetical protein